MAKQTHLSEIAFNQSLAARLRKFNPQWDDVSAETTNVLKERTKRPDILMNFWWHGTRQQEGRARITISRLPALHAIDPRSLTKKQIKWCETLFKKFRHKEFRPAHEAHMDETRIALDEALLVDVLGFSAEEMLEPLSLLRKQWCSEPTVHSGRKPEYAAANE